MLKLSIKNPTTQATETYDVVTEFNHFFNRAISLGLLAGNIWRCLECIANYFVEMVTRLHYWSRISNFGTQV